MNETSTTYAIDYVEISADIVSAYVSNNSISGSDLGILLASVHAAIKGLAENGSSTAKKVEVEKITPAQIRKSVTPNSIISFEDSKPYKTMRRHLAKHGLTPEHYRVKWGLPHDYPMVSPNYSAARSALARSFGLGQRREGSVKAAGVDEIGARTLAFAKSKPVGRPRKAIAAE